MACVFIQNTHILTKLPVGVARGVMNYILRSLIALILIPTVRKESKNAQTRHTVAAALFRFVVFRMYVAAVCLAPKGRRVL